MKNNLIYKNPLTKNVADFLFKLTKNGLKSLYYCWLREGEVMRFLFILSIFIFVLMLAGCGGDEPVIEEYIPTVAVISDETYRDAGGNNDGVGEVVYLDFIIEMLNQPLARHESTEGVFLGAYIARDAVSGGDIASFQEYMQVQHAIFVYSMHLGDPFPLRWVLDNIANHTTPLITLHPVREGDPFDFETFENFAIYAGMFNMPAFVELFPIHASHNFSPMEYVDFFRHARAILIQHAPNVALVWGICPDNLPLAKHFYPGEEALDWIKLTAYNHVDTDGTFEEFGKALSEFYSMFHRSAPLMLSTAVSHHSPANNSLFPAQAAQKLSEIYDILEYHHRIRAVIYRSYSDRAVSGHIYSLNTSPILRDAYRTATANPRFLSLVSRTPHPRRGNITLHHPQPALSHGGSFYVPFEGGVRPIAHVIDRLNGDFFVNKEKGRLTLQVTHWTY